MATAAFAAARVFAVFGALTVAFALALRFRVTGILAVGVLVLRRLLRRLRRGLGRLLGIRRALGVFRRLARAAVALVVLTVTAGSVGFLLCLGLRLGRLVAGFALALRPLTLRRLARGGIFGRAVVLRIGESLLFAFGFGGLAFRFALGFGLGALLIVACSALRLFSFAIVVLLRAIRLVGLRWFSSARLGALTLRTLRVAGVFARLTVGIVAWVGRLLLRFAATL